MQVSWKAVYIDGSVLSQYNENRTENKYTDIKRSELAQFHLLIDGLSKLIIFFDPNKRLIYRRRTAIGTQGTVYLAGWQETVNGVNRQMICFLFEDGHIEIIDRFKENHPWFYNVQFVSCERE